MTHVRYLVAGYASTFVALAGYAVWVSVRSRSLNRSSAAASETTTGSPPPED